MKSIFGLALEYSNIGGMAALYDTVICDKYLGRPMPTKFTDAHL
jgi:hypothetical protein